MNNMKTDTTKTEQKLKPNSLLLLMCRACLLSVPMANMFYMIAIAFGFKDTETIGIVCAVLSFVPILLYENLLRENFLYTESLKK